MLTADPAWPGPVPVSADALRVTQVPEIAGLKQMAGLQKKLTGWLGEAAAAGVDELGMKALFTAALRGFNDRGGAARLPGRDARGGGVARRDGGAA